MPHKRKWSLQKKGIYVTLEVGTFRYLRGGVVEVSWVQEFYFLASVKEYETDSWLPFHLKSQLMIGWSLVKRKVQIIYKFRRKTLAHHRHFISQAIFVHVRTVLSEILWMLIPLINRNSSASHLWGVFSLLLLHIPICFSNSPCPTLMFFTDESPSSLFSII